MTWFLCLEVLSILNFDFIIYINRGTHLRDESLNMIYLLGLRSIKRF